MVPLDILNESKDKKIRVHTTEQDEYTGVLLSFDLYVNIYLSKAELIEFETKENHKLGDTIIQGNRVTFIEILGQ